MKFKSLQIICFIVLIFLSCSDKKSKHKESNIYNWSILDIEIQDGNKIEKFGIFKETDTCSYSLLIKDENHFKKFGSFESKRVNFVLTEDKRQKLFTLFKDLFNKPIRSNNKVSCYAGKNVIFTIDKYYNPALSCTYSSINNWKNCNKTTKEIYDLIYLQFK